MSGGQGRVEMTDLEGKKAQYEKLRQEIRDLEEKERVEKELPGLKKLEGTYWKFRNSYSSPRTDADYWWKYRHVVKVTDDACLEMVDIEIDRYGELKMRHRSDERFSYPSLEWVASSEDEWRIMVAKAIEMVKDIF